MLTNPSSAFPLGPAGFRYPDGQQPPSGPSTRPWILRYAAPPMPTNATTLPAFAYDPERQVNLDLFGGQLPSRETHKASVPDGSVDNPPPLDEGEKD
jgi:putative ATP-grasp target RiPP